ncbi:MAG: ferrous iron transport protein A [Eubacterium sp.]
MRLSQMKENQTGVITAVKSNNKLQRRLFDMGFVSGQEIKCTNIAMSGSPIAYSIRGSKIALRKKDADFIGVIL